MNGEREKTIPLASEIEHKSTIYDQITVKAPTIGQFRQSLAKMRQGQTQESQIQFGVALVARCAGVDEELIDQLPADAFFEALDFASSFLPEEKKEEAATPGSNEQ